MSKKCVFATNDYVFSQIDLQTKVETFCEAGGWTVIQSRGQFNNSKDYFSKLWHEYEIGFGVPGKDF